MNSQSPTPKRSRARRRVLFATLAAASLTGQVLTMSPAAQADDTLGGGRPKPPRSPSIIHGVQEFTADGTFTPPAGVTSVHIQAWGAGGGGGGGGGGASATLTGLGGTGGGGGSGGFTWCVIPVTPFATYSVDLGTMRRRRWCRWRWPRGRQPGWERRRRMGRALRRR